MVQTVLERYSYRVFAVSNARMRWASERYANSIDLMLTDVIMPGMSGPDVAARVMKLRPETKVLLMSGYTEDRVPQGGAAVRFPMLRKPFTASALAERVHEVLDGL
jgi:two-component system, cell cycle sensor histidine kinase and response regulator CckA